MKSPGARAPFIIVDSNTRLNLSQVLDSAEAVKRLAEPARNDHARLIRTPRPLSLFTLLWRDADLGLLVGAILIALVAAGVYVLY